MAQYDGSVEIPKIIEMSNYWILMEIAFAVFGTVRISRQRLKL